MFKILNDDRQPVKLSQPQFVGFCHGICIEFMIWAKNRRLHVREHIDGVRKECCRVPVAIYDPDHKGIFIHKNQLSVTTLLNENFEKKFLCT